MSNRDKEAAQAQITMLEAAIEGTVVLEDQDEAARWFANPFALVNRAPHILRVIQASTAPTTQIAKAFHTSEDIIDAIRQRRPPYNRA